MKYGQLIKMSDEYRRVLLTSLEEHPPSENAIYDMEYYRRFLANDTFVYLGEIVQMPGHIICAGRDGCVYFGFHDDDFEILTDDEV